MNRRRFIQRLLTVAALAATPPSWARPAKIAAPGVSYGYIGLCNIAEPGVCFANLEGVKRVQVDLGTAEKVAEPCKET